MSRYFELALVFLLLWGGMIGIALKLRAERRAKELLLRTKAGLEESDRRHRLKEREELLDITRKNSLWRVVNRELEYSGLKRRFHRISVEFLLAWNTVICAAVLILGWSFGSPVAGFGGALVCLLGEYLVLEMGKAANLKAVNEDLMKLLDFLGSYSLTGGELTGVLGAISPYLNEPLRSVLEECETESRVTGNVSLAVLGMAEKIEHPMFQQLARNLEITSRYSADFEPLVMDSRRGLREYLRQNQERKGMLREAAVNMVLLTVMSIVMLLIVGSLVGQSFGEVLFGNVAGRIGLGVFGSILVLFGGQAMRLNK